MEADSVSRLNNMRLPPGHFCGQNLRTRNVAGLTLTEIAYAPGSHIQTHSHELSQFCFVRQGTFSEVYGRKSRECAPLTLIGRPANETHGHQFYKGGARCFVIEIEHELLRRIREYSPVLDDSVEIQSGLSAWLATRLYNEFNNEDNASSLAMEGLTLELLSEVSRQQARVLEHKPSRWLERARDSLHAHFLEPIALAAIANSVGVHPIHLARVFRQSYGCTVGEYVRRLRIEFACREISQTDKSFTEIAVTAGFYDQGHFSRTFKQMVGLTPGQYRAVFRLSR
jgi:AraC family transcriptional regulator